MKIIHEKQVVTVVINETDTVYYYERFYKDSKILSGSNGILLGNSFRFDGSHPKKYGRGRLKKSEAFYQQLEAIQSFLKKNGYRIY